MLRTALKSSLPKLVALAVIVALYGFTRLPDLPAAERSELAARFRFSRLELPEPPGAGDRRPVRPVNPSVEHISAWISSVGASVALNDLDGDTLSNDVCQVEPRVDEVLVYPAPGTGERFAPFALNLRELAYDPDSSAPMGCLPGDFNEDGRMDLLVYFWGRSPVLYLQRLAAEGRAAPVLSAESFRAVEAVPEVEVWNTNAVTQADVDGDGHVDLIVGNYFRDGERVLDASDRHGVEMQDSMSLAFNAGRNRILLWSGAGSGEEPSARFREAEEPFSAEVAGGWTLAAAAADLDGDLLPEIYFANDFGPDRLLHNRSRPGEVRLLPVEGRRGFTTPKSKVLGRDSFKGMGVDFGDLDGDALLDIYVSNIANEYALEESHFAFVSSGRLDLFAAGVAPYADESEDLGLSRSGFSWEARLADFDNDGVLEAMQATGFIQGTVDRWPELQELAIGNDLLLRHSASWPRFQPGDDLSGHLHNPFFVRSASGRYHDLAPELGIDQVQVSRGIAVSDVDGDGRLDFAVANQWATSYLFHNRSPSPGAHLGLRLLLPTAPAAGPPAGGPEGAEPGLAAGGRPAVGATAVVKYPDGRRQVAQVDGGNGHSGERSPEVHFGLGAVDPGRPVEVLIRWRDAGGQVRERTCFLAPGRHTVWLTT